MGDLRVVQREELEQAVLGELERIRELLPRLGDMLVAPDHSSGR
jgi:hypothetical protein